MQTAESRVSDTHAGASHRLTCISVGGSRHRDCLGSCRCQTCLGLGLSMGAWRYVLGSDYSGVAYVERHVERVLVSDALCSHCRQQVPV